jgi:hypothetical protein
VEAQEVIQLVAAIFGASAVTAVVNALFSRRKMNADVVKTINEAADSAVKRVTEDNIRLRAENHAMTSRVDEVIQKARQAQDRAYQAEQKASRLADALIAYVSYAGRQTEVIRSLGGVIDDPPEVPAELSKTR